MYFPIGWAPDGKGIFVRGPGSNIIKLLSVPGGQVIGGADLPFEEVEEVTVTPNGQGFVCSVAQSESDVWIIENFDPAVTH